MEIEVVCGCGNRLRADSSFAGRELFCPKCKASVPIPERPGGARAPDAGAAGGGGNVSSSDSAPVDAGAAGKEPGGEPSGRSGGVHDSGLFADAIAALKELQGSPGKGASSGEGSASGKPTPTDACPAQPPAAHPVAAETVVAPLGPPASARPDESSPARDAGSADETGRSPAPGAPAEAGVPAVSGCQEKHDDDSARLIRDTDADKGPHHHEAPTSVEVFPDRVKFTCPCGKRISAPLDSSKATGKCPRCGRRLAIPSVKMAEQPAPPESPQDAALPRCRACGKKQAEPGVRFCSSCGAKLEAPAGDEKPKVSSARMAADDAADRLRASRGRPAAPVAAGAAPAAGGAPAAQAAKPRMDAGAPAATASFAGRALALLIDLVAAGVCLIIPVTLLQDGLGLGLGVALSAVAWFANEVGYVTVNGQTFGKALVRISVRSASGGLPPLKATVLRAVVKLFLPGSLMALFDERSRAAHDAAAGTIVVQGWTPPGADGKK